MDFAAGGGASTCPSAVLAVGQACAQSVNFAPAYPGIRLGAVRLLDSSNNVLGTAYLSGKGLGGLGVMVPGNVVVAAGNGAYEQVDDGQLAINADLNLPSSLVLDGAGNMYIADSGHHRIRKVDAATGLISTVVGNGNALYSGDNGAAVNATLNTPSGIAIDGAGNLYIADTGNNVVRKVAASTGKITTFAGNINATALGDGGPATSANLNQPQGVTVDPAGNLFIADTNNHRIRRVDVNTGIINTVAGNGTTAVNGSGSYSGDNGPAIAAGLNFPFAVAFDAAGDMYIPDASNNRVRMVNTSGVITTFAGVGTVGNSGDGGPATSAGLWYPAGVIVDAAQNTYISDSQNNSIRKVSAASGNISTVVFNSKSFGNGGVSTISLYGPRGLALDGSGNLFIADYLFMRIREVQSNVSVLDFTNVPIRNGDRSKPIAQMLENDGTASLKLSSITPVANSALSDDMTTCDLEDAMPINNACSVGAEFAPTSAGDPLVGNIDVVAAAVDSPLHIELVGNATAVNSTTTVLTASPNPANFGQVVTFRAAVATGEDTGPLTGSITFTDTTTGTVLQKGAPVNSSGIATFTIPSLSVGLHAITAAYGGDSLHFASVSDPVSQVVNEVTVTSITSNANPAAVGAVVTFTTTVTISGGGGVAPDGTVTFNDGTTVLGTAAINASGIAAYSTSSLGDGIHSITAVYSGDPARYILGSTSGSFSQDLQAASTAVVTSSPNPSEFASAVTFTVMVTSNGSVAPTGTVKILDGGKTIGSGTLAGTTGVATFTTTSLIAGSHAITAAYQGSANDGPATSVPIVQTVNKTATFTTVSGTPDPGIAGKPVTLTASVHNSSGTATTNGTVTFMDGTSTLANGSLGANGTASISLKLAPGAHAIVATYGGDANDNASTSSALALPINLAATAVALTSDGSPAYVLAPIVFTAVLSSNGGTPTGTVTFYADGASVSSANLDASGKATFSDSALGVGSHTITATYNGDSDDSRSNSATLTEVVQSIPTTTSLGTGSTGGTNPQSILVSTVIGAGGPVPTGTVTFTSAGKTIGIVTLDASGVGTLVPDLAPASYTIAAAYSGDAIHGPSTSSSIQMSGVPVGFGITINPSTVSLATSQNTTISIDLTSNNGYADTIGLGCGTLPAGVSCHFAANDIALKPGGSNSVQLTIDTNAPLLGGSTAMNRGTDRGGLSLADIFLPAGLLFGCISWRFRKRNRLALGVFVLLLLSGAMVVTGCGAQFSQSSAKPGTYTIQINGVGVKSNITHYQNITLTITK
ncbi:MAG TPA: Ig-like domain repeat protein [Terracidiphilus sp.]